MGQVALNTQQEDLIVVIMCATISFNLRPNGKECQMVGQSYIHGIVNGEAFAFSDDSAEEFI